VRPSSLLAESFAVAVTVAGCRAALPAPPPPQILPLQQPQAPTDDPARSVVQIRQLESACRARLQSDTVRASLAAVDRMRMALGAVCDVESVGDDPLHWLFRCRADAFFQLGRYALEPSAASPCPDAPSLHGAAVDRWACAGALLQSARASLGNVQIAVVGHVDDVRLAPGRAFNPCPELRAAVGYVPSPPWTELTASAPPDARRAGNDQLAWCRAANVARHLQCGMTASRRTVPASSGDPCADIGPPPSDATVTILGASTAWQDAQPPAACSAPPDPTEAYHGYCAEARRVDVFVKFVPTAASVRSPCVRTGDDPATALWCLQDCLERAAAPTRADLATDVPLLVPCSTQSGMLPQGWFRSPVLDANGRCMEVNLDAVRRSLHITP